MGGLCDVPHPPLNSPACLPLTDCFVVLACFVVPTADNNECETSALVIFIVVDVAASACSVVGGELVGHWSLQ